MNNIFRVLMLSMALLVSIVNGFVKAPEKVPWPRIFKQSFNLIVGSNATQKQTLGTHWYNWNIKSMQLDYSNSQIFHSCWNQVKSQTPCTILYGDKQAYIYFTEKRLCCYLGSDEQIPAPEDIVRDFYFNTTGKINDQEYYIWALNDEQEIINYYTTMAPNQVTRRFYYPQVVTNYDYILGSYSQQITNPNIFKVPSYCRKQQRCSTGTNEDKVVIHGKAFNLGKKKLFE